MLRSVSAEDIRSELIDVNAQLDALEERRINLSMMLEVKRAREPVTASSNGSSAQTTMEKPTLRQGIKRVLEEHPPGTTLKLADIGEVMRGRGWLDDGKNSQHRLQMAASNMTKRQELIRPRTGYYHLPQATMDGGKN
jgi:hypothetical protein